MSRPVCPKIEARNERIAELYRSGLSAREVAAKLGMTVYAVANVVDNMGISRREAARPEPRRAWCGQCERRVMMAEASRCGSPWCKAKAVAA